MELYFTQYFGLDPAVLDDYGALDISIVSDLPLFIDPFLLFHSDKPEYQLLHQQILEYLRFLKSQASASLSPALITNWYAFREVKQNWLGFTVLGNGGSGLGRDFAVTLHRSLGSILDNFGSETITRSSHLEKLCLISPGVGRDNISDFTTNLIQDYLLTYTQTFAQTHLRPEQCSTFAVPRAKFNYSTHAWQTSRYVLPKVNGDFVLLTPLDILTRDETWISHDDMIKSFDNLPVAVEDDVLRAQINHYFASQLGNKPTQKERARAASRTISEYPILIDHYIREKEDQGDQAEAVSAEKTKDLQNALIDQVKLAIPDIESKSDFYDKPWTSYDEVRERVQALRRARRRIPCYQSSRQALLSGEGSAAVLRSHLVQHRIRRQP